MCGTEPSESYRLPFFRGPKCLTKELGVFKRLSAYWTCVRARSSEAILFGAAKAEGVAT
jgi:hypothetical protein